MRRRMTKYNKSKFLNILTRDYIYEKHMYDKKNKFKNNTVMDIIINNFV